MEQACRDHKEKERRQVHEQARSETRCRAAGQAARTPDIKRATPDFKVATQLFARQVLAHQLRVHLMHMRALDPGLLQASPRLFAQGNRLHMHFEQKAGHDRCAQE